MKWINKKAQEKPIEISEEDFKKFDSFSLNAYRVSAISQNAIDLKKENGDPKEVERLFIKTFYFFDELLKNYNILKNTEFKHLMK